LQRLDNSNRLLWLVQPRINTEADSQFGPYAYRSSAAQYFNLVWPLCLGLWWVLRHQVKNSLRSAARVGSSAHAMLLPGAVVMAACPIIATSRGGAIVAAVGMALAFSVLLLASSRGHWGGRLGLIALFAAMIGFAGYLGWEKLEERLRYVFTDEMSGRVEIYENSRKIVKDLPVYGTGPGTFASMYHLYRANPQQVWQGYLHDDWLETRVTFGAVGLSLILLALSLAFARGFATGGIVVPTPFVALVWLALAGCLFHARYDFPLQVHSILSLFLTLCAILFCCSRKT